MSPELDIIVITPEITEEWNREIKEGNKQPYVFIAFDEHNYLTLSKWLNDVLRYIKSQNELISTYENSND